MKRAFNIAASFAIVFLLLLTWIACRKKKSGNCTNFSCTAQFYIGNRTHDTIYYSIGSTMYTDTLLPGQTKSSTRGNVHKEYSKLNCQVTSEGSSVITVYSTAGDWFVNIDKCDNRADFKYDGTVVRLYDVD